MVEKGGFSEPFLFPFLWNRGARTDWAFGCDFHEGRGVRKKDDPPGIEDLVVYRVEKRMDMSLSDV